MQLKKEHFCKIIFVWRRKTCHELEPVECWQPVWEWWELFAEHFSRLVEYSQTSVQACPTWNTVIMIFVSKKCTHFKPVLKIHLILMRILDQQVKKWNRMRILSTVLRNNFKNYMLSNTKPFVSFIQPVSEFNEFKPPLKSPKNRFQLSAG